MKQIIPVLLTGLLAGVLAVVLHIVIGTHVGGAVSVMMRGRHVLMPPYPANITITAIATAVLPGIGMTILYSLVVDRLPGGKWYLKGLCFSVLILFAKGELVRQPLMDLLIGNPIQVVLLQRLEPWLVSSAESLVIAALIALAKASKLQPSVGSIS